MGRPIGLAYHGTPITPAAFMEELKGRRFCVSFYRPDGIAAAARLGAGLMLDNGAFSFWKQAKAKGLEADEQARDWRPYYAWCERWLDGPGRWAVIPDRIGAPSQINDGLLNDWPPGLSGAPVWHMDGPLERLGRLCERWPLVCLGWLHPDEAQNQVGSEAYHARMAEVAAFLGNRWPPLHMLRGLAVLPFYPFASADSTSLAQNGHRHDDRPLMAAGELAGPWAGRLAYADKLEWRAGVTAAALTLPRPRQREKEAAARQAGFSFAP